MTHIFYLITACVLAILPVLNGYIYIACLLFIFALLSPIKVLVAQWIAILLWIVWCGRTGGPPLMLDEYYLYLLNAFIFILGFPFYISHRKQPQKPWMRLFLEPARYMLLALAVFLLLSTLFRSCPLSNAVWAIACYLYGFFLPTSGILINKTTVLGYTILLSSVVIAALLLVEIGVRIIFVGPPPPGEYFMPHNQAIFAVRPNSKSSIVIKNNNGNLIKVNRTISSQGIRDHEYGPKTPNVFRIVLLGDSYTMGYGLEADETIDNVLERLLLKEHMGIHIQVINCGHGAYAPWQERILLQEKGFTFEPDLVILQLFPPNDVAGSYSKVGKYLDAIDVEWEQLLQSFRLQHQWPVHIERVCKKHSQAYRLVLAVVNHPGIIRPLLEQYRLYSSTHYPPITPRTNRNPYIEVCLKDWYPKLEEAWGIYTDSIRGIRDDCLEEGVDLIAYAHSDQISICPPSEWDKLNERFPDSPYEINKDIRLTNELLEELNVPYVDILSALKKYSVEDIYYIYDGHFTPKGAEVVAECLRDYLLEHYFIETSTD